MTMRFGTVVLLCVFCLQVQAQDKDTHEEEIREAVSLLESHVANLSAIEDMDVAMEWSTYRYSDDLQMHDDVIVKARLVLDADQKLGVFASVKESRRFQDGQKSLPLQKMVRVAYQDGDKVAKRMFPGSVDWLRLASDDHPLRFGDYPELRLIGAYASPVSSSSMPEAIVQKVLKIGLSPHPSMRVRLLPGGEAEVTERGGLAGETGTQRIYDVKHNVLKSVRASRQKKDSKVMVPFLVERIQWRQAGAIYVPARIEGEQRVKAPGPDGESADWTEQYECNFRWFAVNSELKMAAEYRGVLEAMNEALRFVEAAGEEDVTTALE